MNVDDGERVHTPAVPPAQQTAAGAASQLSAKSKIQVVCFQCRPSFFALGQSHPLLWTIAASISMLQEPREALRPPRQRASPRPLATNIQYQYLFRPPSIFTSCNFSCPFVTSPVHLLNPIGDIVLYTGYFSRPCRTNNPVHPAFELSILTAAFGPHDLSHHFPLSGLNELLPLPCQGPAHTAV